MPFSSRFLQFPQILSSTSRHFTKMSAFNIENKNYSCRIAKLQILANNGLKLIKQVVYNKTNIDFFRIPKKKIFFKSLAHNYYSALPAPAPLMFVL